MKRSEKKYYDLFERSDDAILIIKNRTFVDCNEATVKILRYNNKSELLNTHPSELSPKLQPDGKESSEKADEMMKIAVKNGNHRFEWDHKRADGEVFPVEVLLTLISADGEDEILYTIWRDITERKLAEEALRQSEERYRFLFENSLVGITISDRSGIILTANERECLITGYSLRELKKTHLGKIYSNLGDRKRLLNILDREKRVENFEVLQKKKNGEKFWVNISAKIVKLDGKERILSSITDITEKKEAEKQLVALKNELEDKVKEKTKELQERISELEIFFEATVERELKMEEMRKRIKELEKQIC